MSDYSSPDIDPRATTSPDDRHPIRARAGESPDLADADDSFRSGPGHFPRVYIPAWVAFHPDLDEGAIAVAVFVAAYRSTSDDKIPFVGRRLIARRFRRSLDWVDRRTRALCEAGHLHRIRVYRDAVTGERTLNPVSSDGALNPQVTNDWVFSDAPPEGDRHPHPIMSSEYSHPERITKRIRRRERLRSAIEEGGPLHSGRGPNRANIRKSQVGPQPLHSGRGGRSTAALTETKENRDHINNYGGGDDGSSLKSETSAGAPGGMEEARALLERVRQRCAPELRVLPSYVTAVAEQLAAGHSAAAIERVLAEARAYRSPAAGVVEQVRALPDLLASRPRRQPVPPWCGECDPEGEARPSLRVIETADGRTRRCPRCHPDVVAAAGSGDQSDAAAAESGDQGGAVPSGPLDELSEALAGWSL